MATLSERCRHVPLAVHDAGVRSNCRTTTAAVGAHSEATEQLAEESGERDPERQGLEQVV
eukprot:13940616-Heterocapsa_arctica.AAC.1